MNKLLIFSSLILLTFFSTSCQKTVIQVRVDNQYPYDIYNVVVGPDNFGTVTSGQTTSYMNIPEGSGNISGETANNLPLTGTYSFSGTSPGNNPYTINISSTGAVTLTKN